LGWYAKVISGDVPQSNLAILVVLFGLWFGGMILIGVILLITSGILALVGSMRSSIALTGRGAVYAETFAVWFTLFVGLQLGIPRLLVFAGLPDLIIPGAVIAMFSSLFALAWPVLRGVSWSDVRRDVGLHTGKGLIREVLVGPLVYAAGLPLMATGLIIYSIARSLSPETQQATHPIVEQFAGGGWNVVVIYLLACVAAPIVEEIAFRGILYRHLRESGRWIGAVGSAVVATLVSSVLFAGIHPQGLLFIPVLGGLATAFCFGREWRGSLVSCMVAHAMNNAVTITLGVSLANG
jgi:membrane protease YdiL (CAAX protease family)